MDGSSLAGMLRGGSVPDWTTTALIEHHRPDVDVADPDYPQPGSGNPPTYRAIHTATYTYVEYATRDAEYYNRVKDPLELDNIVSQLSQGRREHAHRTLQELATCQGAHQCGRAWKGLVACHSSSVSV
jgi:hypothetical protein